MTMTVNELDALAGYRFDAVATSSDYVRFANDVGVASDEYASVEVRSMTRGLFVKRMSQERCCGGCMVF